MNIVKVNDSAAPYARQKDVILCRSGKQIYHKSEVTGVAGKPPVEKDFYVEYRPATVVVDAVDLCKNLPVTKEHPDNWVTDENCNLLMGGTTDGTVTPVTIETDSGKEIGLKTKLTFYSKELDSYYEQHNREVSLGYLSERHFVSNPEKVGYDIILDKIVKVNHVALTSSGRGGSSVAVIDSLFGGLKPMKTGLFAGLNIFSKKEKDFGKAVCDSAKKSKATNDEELAKDMKSVLDSCATLKDSDAKTELLDAVKDAFSNKDLINGNEEELAARLNGFFDKAECATKDSMDAVLKNKEDEKEEAGVDDSKAKGKPDEDPADKAEDSDEEKEDKSEDSDKEDKEDKEEDACGKAKDSAYATKEELSSMKKDIVAEVTDAMSKQLKEMFGTEDKTPDGGKVDNVNDSVKSASELYGTKYSDLINK